MVFNVFSVIGLLISLKLWTWSSDKFLYTDFIHTLGESQNPRCPFMGHLNVHKPVMSLIHITCYARRLIISVESNGWMDPKRRTLVPADLVGENKDLQSMPCLILSLIFLFEYGGLVLDLSLLALWSLSALVLSRIHPDTIFKKKFSLLPRLLNF